jgi:predicted deacylase
MNELHVGTAVAAPGSVVRGIIKIGELPDGTPLGLPTVVVRGVADGPRLWVQACIHGNEYAGAFIVHAFLRTLDPGQLRGAVVAIPALNITAFHHGRRTSPFEGYGIGDLNRCFPGKPDGTFTEQMGHAIFTEMKQVATHLVDFHTGGDRDTRWTLFPAVEAPAGKEAEAMVRAFGFEVILPAPPTTLANAAFMVATRHGIPGIIVEAGGKYTEFDDALVADASRRLHNLARHLGLLPGTPAPVGPATYISDFAWYRTTRGGLFRPALRSGTRVKQGDLIGRLYDIYGTLVEEVPSPATGIVLTVSAGPVMAPGDTLIQIGLDPREV